MPWRPAMLEDDRAITMMCLALNREDPGDAPVEPAQIARTLAVLRAEPWRGRAVVLGLGGEPLGYALLIASWSNELGGEVCVIDEMYVAPAARGHGHGGALLEALDGTPDLWPRRPAALVLEVTPSNQRAIALYERHGFRGHNRAMRRRG